MAGRLVRELPGAPGASPAEHFYAVRSRVERKTRCGSLRKRRLTHRLGGGRFHGELFGTAGVERAPDAERLAGGNDDVEASPKLAEIGRRAVAKVGKNLAARPPGLPHALELRR